MKSDKFAYRKYEAELEIQKEEKEADKRVIKQKSDVKEFTNTKNRKTLLTKLLSP